MENNSQPNKDLKTSVLEKIREGKVRMHPRAYFVAKMAALIAVAALFFITTTFLASYICFSLNEGHRGALLGFGQRGVSAFLAVFPWWALIADVAFLAAFEWLFRRFRIAYRRSWVYIFLGTLVVIAGASLALCQTPLHPFLLDHGEKGDLPFIGGMYGDLRHSAPDRGVFRGTIMSISGSMIVMQHNDYDSDWDEGGCGVLVPSGMDISAFKAGDDILVAGQPVGKCQIQAYGIQKISEGDMMPPQKPEY